MGNDSKVFIFLFLKVFYPFHFSGKIACREVFFAMMLLPVKLRFDTLILCFFFRGDFVCTCIVLFDDAWIYFDSLLFVFFFLEMHGNGLGV